MNIVHKLRDLDAWLTSYGQCIRCHRSWRYASPVKVGYGVAVGAGGTGHSFFCLCIDCYRWVTDGHLPGISGLVLQAWAEKAIERNERTGGYYDRREILAAYGTAYRFPVELETGWSGPDHYRVRVLDRRSLIQPTRPGRRDTDPAPGWDGAGSDTPYGDMEVNRG